MPTARPFGAVADAYQAQVGTGKLLADEAQASAVQKFDALATALQRIPAPAPSAEPSSSSGGNGEGWLSRLGFSSARKPEPRAAARSSSAPRGLYLWGGTGSGKTALMDLFYDTLPVPPSAKMRVHFHSFMQKVHGQLHSDRAAGKHKDDPLGAVARRWAEGVKVLCLDELFVTDVGDAMIMARLFDQFVAHGVIIVATSNRPPDDLYKHGLNRELFLPCIELLKTRCEVLELASPVDYRLLAEQVGHTWCTGKAGEATLETTWQHVTQNEEPIATSFTVHGRHVPVPRAVPAHAAAWFTFDDLCNAALGSGDYLALAAAYRAVFVAHVPKLTMEQRSAVRRFITLVDALYDAKVKLFVSAEAPFTETFQPGGSGGNGASTPHPSTSNPAHKGTRLHVGDEEAYGGADEVFAFDRTVSRLQEMGTQEYLRLPWQPRG